jgi:RNA polymerase sigma-70 factor (ECF subfamily)
MGTLAGLPTSKSKDDVSAEDRRLIAECLKGRTTAFGELIRRYQDRLFNTVFRLVNNVEDAQDIVQESFLSAYQSLGEFKGDAQFFTWLYRIAVNAAMTMKRRRKAIVSIEARREESHGMVEPLDPSEYSRPGRALEQVEEDHKIQMALQRLSPEHRAVLVLKDMEGQKYEEMAEILQVPVGTIRSRLHRARLELKALLEQIG